MSEMEINASDDIYCDLDDFDTDIKLSTINAEKDNLVKENANLKEIVQKQSQEIEALTKQNEILKRNITILYRTGRQISTRKHKTILTLQAELENVKFRRDKRGPNANKRTFDSYDTENYIPKRLKYDQVAEEEHTGFDRVFAEEYREETVESPSNFPEMSYENKFKSCKLNEDLLKIAQNPDPRPVAPVENVFQRRARLMQEKENKTEENEKPRLPESDGQTINPVESNPGIKMETQKEISPENWDQIESYGDNYSKNDDERFDKQRRDRSYSPNSHRRNSRERMERNPIYHTKHSRSRRHERSHDDHRDKYGYSKSRNRSYKDDYRDDHHRSYDHRESRNRSAHYSRERKPHRQNFNEDRKFGEHRHSPIQRNFYKENRQRHHRHETKENYHENREFNRYHQENLRENYQEHPKSNRYEDRKGPRTPPPHTETYGDYKKSRENMKIETEIDSTRDTDPEYAQDIEKSNNRNKSRSQTPEYHRKFERKRSRSRFKVYKDDDSLDFEWSNEENSSEKSAEDAHPETLKSSRKINLDSYRKRHETENSMLTFIDNTKKDIKEQTEVHLEKSKNPENKKLTQSSTDTEFCHQKNELVYGGQKQNMDLEFSSIRKEAEITNIIYGDQDFADIIDSVEEIHQVINQTSPETRLPSDNADFGLLTDEPRQVTKKSTTDTKEIQQSLENTFSADKLHSEKSKTFCSESKDRNIESDLNEKSVNITEIVQDKRSEEDPFKMSSNNHTEMMENDSAQCPDQLTKNENECSISVQSKETEFQKMVNCMEDFQPSENTSIASQKNHVNSPTIIEEDLIFKQLEEMNRSAECNVETGNKLNEENSEGMFNKDNELGHTSKDQTNRDVNNDDKIICKGQRRYRRSPRKSLEKITETLRNKEINSGESDKLVTASDTSKLSAPAKGSKLKTSVSQNKAQSKEVSKSSESLQDEENTKKELDTANNKKMFPNGNEENSKTLENGNKINELKTANNFSEVSNQDTNKRIEKKKAEKSVQKKGSKVTTTSQPLKSKENVGKKTLEDKIKVSDRDIDKEMSRMFQTSTSKKVVSSSSEKSSAAKCLKIETENKTKLPTSKNSKAEEHISKSKSQHKHKSSSRHSDKEILKESKSHRSQSTDSDKVSSKDAEKVPEITKTNCQTKHGSQSLDKETPKSTTVEANKPSMENSENSNKSNAFKKSSENGNKSPILDIIYSDKVDIQEVEPRNEHCQSPNTGDLGKESTSNKAEPGTFEEKQKSTIPDKEPSSSKHLDKVDSQNRNSKNSITVSSKENISENSQSQNTGELNKTTESSKTTLSDISLDEFAFLMDASLSVLSEENTSKDDEKSRRKSFEENVEKLKNNLMNEMETVNNSSGAITESIPTKPDNNDSKTNELVPLKNKHSVYNREVINENKIRIVVKRNRRK